MLTASKKNVSFLTQEIHQSAKQRDQKSLESLLPLDITPSDTPTLFAIRNAIKLLAEQGEIAAVNLLLAHPVANPLDAIEGYAFGGHENELKILLAFLLAKNGGGEAENEANFLQTLYSLATGFARQGCDYQVCMSKPKELFRQQCNMSEKEELRFKHADIFLPTFIFKAYAQEGYYPDMIDEFIKTHCSPYGMDTIASGYVLGKDLSRANNLIQTLISSRSENLYLFTSIEHSYARSGHLDGPNLFRTLCLTENEELRKRLAEYAKDFNNDFEIEPLLKKVAKGSGLINILIKQHNLSFEQAETYWFVMSESRADNLVSAFLWEYDGNQLLDQHFIPEEIKECILSYVLGRSEQITREFFTVAKQRLGFFVDKIPGASSKVTEQKNQIVDSKFH